MKKLIIASTLVIATALSGSLMAEATSQDRHQQYLDRISERLELTPEQKREVGELHAEQYEKHKALREERKSRLNEILTPEQSEKLEQMHTERKERMQKHYGKGGDHHREG